MERLLPDGYTRLVFFSDAGHRLDVSGRFGVSANSPTSARSEFVAASGGTFPLSKEWSVGFDVYEGEVADRAAVLARLSNRWHAVALGVGRHVQAYEPAPLMLGAAREGPGGWAAERLTLAVRGKDPEVQESDDLLALLGWADCQFVDDNDVSGGPGRMLRTRHGGRVVSYGRRYAWRVTEAPVVYVGLGWWHFPGAATVTGRVPFPVPGARLRLVADAALGSATLTFYGSDGVALGAAVDASAEAGVVVPDAAFEVEASFETSGRVNLRSLRLVVVDPGESVARSYIPGEAEPPEDFIGLALVDSDNVALDSGDGTVLWG